MPVLRRLRAAVADGVKLHAALASLPVDVEREFARAELGAVLPTVSLEQLDYWGDTELRLWLVDRALRKCGALHRGGHHVTRGAA